MNPTAPSTPVAVGMDTTASGTYVFYQPGANSMPDTSKPFTTPGNYLLALAEVDMATMQQTAVYMYTSGTQGVVQFPVASSLAWSDFTQQP